MKKKISTEGTSLESIESIMQQIRDGETWFEKYIENPLYHRVWTPITNFYRGLCYLPGNIKRFYNVVWNYRVWDSGYTLNLLKSGLEGQLECLEGTKVRGWASETVDRDIKDIKITLEVLRRMDDDTYCQKSPVVFKSGYYERVSKSEKQDIEMLGEQIKKIRRWWD